MKKFIIRTIAFWLGILSFSCSPKEEKARITKDFTLDWYFKLGDHPEAVTDSVDFTDWRKLDLPHDWSIEGEFSEDNPAKPEGGALPTGIGWYVKTFSVEEVQNGKNISITFDGVYRNSEVWINGHYLGKRPYGYITFQYDLTKYIKYGTTLNMIAVKVDNSEQPNSRWYTGSGIYRNVWLTYTNSTHIDAWGTYVTTPEVSKEKAKVKIETAIKFGTEKTEQFRLVTQILNQQGELVVESEQVVKNSKSKITQQLNVESPELWDVNHPYLYRVQSKLYQDNKLIDDYQTPLGIRTFRFEAATGFYLNNKPVKIQGVCLHHDLGALGAAINTAAIKRRLVALKEMGVNAIRTAHNPPSPEFLALCDSMGFIVQDEIFDVWQKKKVKQDYNVNFKDWHQQDLQDWVKRDRNHPSVMMWSIGNEIREQFDSTGIAITQELTKLVKKLDATRPVTSALTENIPEKNYIYQSGALDLLGFNYKHEAYEDLPNRFKGAKFISSESVSGLMTRGHYDAVPESTLFWPPAHNQPFDGNEDLTVSAYDKVAAYWGATHEETWKTVKRLDFIAGMFVWTGVDYLGEPIPYPYPARSSYFGILDLAGFPKDVYYMYQSEWSSEDVLHLLPHWNWNVGDTVDVWAYYNHADEVELFLNGKSLGKQAKQGDELHVSWKVPFESGELKAISYKAGAVVKETVVKAAGKAEKIHVQLDKNTIASDKKDMIFCTVTITDANGVMVPDADNLVNFEVTGGGIIAGVDNGYQASMESFKAPYRKAYNGKCLLIIQSNGKKEPVLIKATSEGIQSIELKITTN